MVNAEGPRGRFPTTRWSLIIAAQEKKPQSEVLNTLCDLYWYPIYAYIRRRGHDKPAADDLTQGFFAYVLERQSVQAVDRNRGKFRAFLLGSLEHFMSHERERAGAIKRGGGVVHVRIDADTAERLYQLEPVADETPEEIFERRWALQLLDTALEQLRFECQKRNKPRHHEVLLGLLDSENDRSYQDVAETLGMTLGSVRTAVHRLRIRFRNILRKLIATTDASPESVDDELRYLSRVFAR